jgi:hypothetical protein
MENVRRLLFTSLLLACCSVTVAWAIPQKAPFIECYDQNRHVVLTYQSDQPNNQIIVTSSLPELNSTLYKVRDTLQDSWQAIFSDLNGYFPGDEDNELGLYFHRDHVSAGLSGVRINGSYITSVGGCSVTKGNL